MQLPLIHLCFLRQPLACAPASKFSKTICSPSWTQVAPSLLSLVVPLPGRHLFMSSQKKSEKCFLPVDPKNHIYDLSLCGQIFFGSLTPHFTFKRLSQYQIHADYPESKDSSCYIIKPLSSGKTALGHQYVDVFGIIFPTVEVYQLGFILL